MSTKSHTKNQLARISAKIQQLKKKYPTSSELYIPSDKPNSMTKPPILNEFQDCKSNFQPLNKNSQPEKTSKHHSRNSPLQDSKENADRSSQHQNSFVHTEFNPNGRFYEQRKYHQSCNKKSLLNKENIFPFTQDLNYQKPFKEYKEELKNLKKQILSSLDFQNFQLSKQKAQNTPKIISNSFDTFSKKDPLNLISDTVFMNQSLPQKQETEIKEKEFQNSQKQKNLTNKIIQESQNSMVTEELTSINQASHQLEPAKNYQSHLSLQYLNQILQKLHESFHSHKQEVTQRLERVEYTSEGYLKQNAQMNFRVQSIERQIKNKELLKASQFDMKIVEIQNQSIGKLSKQVHKEIELINAEINAIKQQYFDAEKSSESQSIQFSKEMIESFSQALRQEMMEKFEFNSERYQKQLNEMESKFFREIFDVKNQIQLMNQKIKKQEYLEKTLKTLIPQSARGNETKTEELSQKIRNELLKDEQFLFQLNLKLKTSLDTLILEEICSKISSEVSQVQSQISDQISKELSSMNKTLKQFQTKMISYGILIQNVEQGLKEISNSQNDEKIESELVNKIKDAVIKEIDSEFSSKIQYRLKESTLKEEDSKGFSKDSRRKASEEIESEKTELQICPIVNERNYISNDVSQVSIFTAQEVNSDIWLTSVDEQPCRKMFHSEVRVYEKPRQVQKSQPSSLLDQLVKNSLVFSALNH